MTSNPKKENELALLARAVWGDSAVEFLVGALSSVVTESQLDALIISLTPVGTLSPDRLSSPKENARH